MFVSRFQEVNDDEIDFGDDQIDFGTDTIDFGDDIAIEVVGDENGKCGAVC